MLKNYKKEKLGLELGLRIRLLWIGLGAAAIFLRYILVSFPGLVETIYSRGIFLGIRYVLDYSINLLPFPVLYLVLIFLLIFAGFLLFRQVKENRAAKKDGKSQERLPFILGLARYLLTAGAALGAAVFAFYFLWGFNYLRLPVEVQLNIKPVPLDTVAIEKEAEIAFQVVADARQSIPGASNNALDFNFIPANMEDAIRDSLEKVLKTMGFPRAGRVRARRFRPSGLLMGFAVSGIYVPFTGEAYVPYGLTASELPFTMAHEMSHGYGFTDEGTANFLAYLACLSSPEPFIRYSGCLMYLEYIAPELARANREKYEKMRQELPPGIGADMRAAADNWKRYYSWLWDVSETVNDAYLKSQGIREGVKSYNRMVLLVTAWRKASSLPKTGKGM